VIHFNFGLHDLKYADEKGTLVADVTQGKPQIAPADYERNLRQLVERLRATGASLVWCSTTPVPEGAAGRVVGDDVKYNEVAARVMREAGVPTNDLYAFAKPRLAEIQRKADVHCTAKG
jgi:acyl-CoA thioesterase-1